jgi:sugar phosphate isomerase/epimerase
MRYGLSTHLYHGQPLSRAHLDEIASFDFDAIEVFATRSHIDYHAREAVDALAGWLRDLGLRLHGIHAPITDAFTNDRWGRTFSMASADSSRRQEAVREATLALELARRVPVDVLVVHLGIPSGQQAAGPDNVSDAARRSVEEIQKVAQPLGVRVAIEVIPNELSSPEALVRLLEEDLPGTGAGICFDFGHAHLLGDVVDAVECVAGHMITTHVHDNDGRADSHLVPLEGQIDWGTALMAVQKIGYEGTLLFEVADTSTPKDVLEKTRRARARLDTLLI